MNPNPLAQLGNGEHYKVHRIKEKLNPIPLQPRNNARSFVKLHVVGLIFMLVHLHETIAPFDGGERL